MQHDIDRELATWRDRLAAASRNVSELSELPEYAAARLSAGGAGRLADMARHLVATMDELWQGVLLIGATLDRAEQARTGGSRLWRSEDSAEQARAILHGPSITVDLAETPVLHRRLLAGPRATATVSPDTLLQTMEAAFDRARESLARITRARSEAEALHQRLAAQTATLPGADTLAAELTACRLADPLDRLAALEALAARLAVFEQANAALDAARQALPGGSDELATWLEQIARTLAAGRAPAALVGLKNWQAMRSAVAREEELRARYGALRAKQRARTGAAPELDALAATVKAALALKPMDLDRVARVLEDYEAALAGRKDVLDRN